MELPGIILKLIKGELTQAEKAPALQKVLAQFDTVPVRLHPKLAYFVLLQLSQARQARNSETKQLQDERIGLLFKAAARIVSKQRKQNVDVIFLQHACFFIRITKSPQPFQLLRIIVLQTPAQELPLIAPKIASTLFHFVLDQYQIKPKLSQRIDSYKLLTKFAERLNQSPDFMAEFAKRMSALNSNIQELVTKHGRECQLGVVKLSESGISQVIDQTHLLTLLQVHCRYECLSLNRKLSLRERLYLTQQSQAQIKTSLDQLRKRAAQFDNAQATRLLYNCLRASRILGWTLGQDESQLNLLELCLLRPRQFVSEVSSQTQLVGLLASHLKYANREASNVAALKAIVVGFGQFGAVEAVAGCEQSLSYSSELDHKRVLGKLVYLYFYLQRAANWTLQLRKQAVWTIAPSCNIQTRNQLALLERVLRLTICVALLSGVQTLSEQADAAYYLLAFPLAAKGQRQVVLQSYLSSITSSRKDFFQRTKHTVFQRILGRLARNKQLLDFPGVLFSNLFGECQASERMEVALDSLNWEYDPKSVKLIRRMVLKSSHWVQILRSNFRKIYMAPLEREEGSQNYSTNDDQNVQINNLLGVLLIQLDKKWMIALDGPRTRVPALELLIQIAKNCPKMLFFQAQYFLPRFRPFMSSVLEQIKEQTAFSFQSLKLLLSLLRQVVQYSGSENQEVKTIRVWAKAIPDLQGLGYRALLAKQVETLKAELTNQ